MLGLQLSVNKNSDLECKENKYKDRARASNMYEVCWRRKVESLGRGGRETYHFPLQYAFPVQ